MLEEDAVSDSNHASFARVDFALENLEDPPSPTSSLEGVFDDMG